MPPGTDQPGLAGLHTAGSGHTAAGLSLQAGDTAGLEHTAGCPLGVLQTAGFVQTVRALLKRTKH